MAINITDSSATFDEWRINTNILASLFGDADNVSNDIKTILENNGLEVNLVNILNLMANDVSRLNIIRASVLA